jgi:Histone H1-like protein Hc1
MENYHYLVELVNSLGADVAKIEAGNKAARTRVRVGLQVVKKLA